MSQVKEQRAARRQASPPARRSLAKPRVVRVFRDLDGKPLFEGEKGTNLKQYTVDKFDADVLVYWHGEEEIVVPGKDAKHKDKLCQLTQFNPDFALGESPLKPGFKSPVCAKCKLYDQKCLNPFLPYLGAKEPIVTIIVDGVGRGEDDRGEIATNGDAMRIKRIIEESEEETGVKLTDIRWLAMTRCANRADKLLNLKPRGAWCRQHVVDDIMRHPPRLLMPVGTTVLGLLSHKSNAQEWSGRLLTYRGWPDDWLTNRRYATPRLDPRDPAKQIIGHPVFGPVPEWRIPMVPIQTPRLVYKDQNQTLNERYRKSIIRALKMAKSGVAALDYIRPWYEFTEEPERIKDVLNDLLKHPGLLICYDTETTGLRPWITSWDKVGDEMRHVVGDGRSEAKVVSMMFRWVDPATNEPRSLGFPWESDRWKVYPHLEELRPIVWKVLTQSKIVGHNLTFDAQFTWAVLQRRYTYGDRSGWSDRQNNLRRDKLVCDLANACQYDTWHMAFAWQQKKGSYGLEAMAYDWVPDLAGYEEDFTLLIDLHRDSMHPGANKGGHYLNCPKDKVATHLVPYVMGDVEVTYRAYERIQEKLEYADVYEIPLADPRYPGDFRYFKPRDRNWVYQNIMSPASRLLTKMMIRGMYVDQGVLKQLAEKMPAEVTQLRKELATVDPRIVSYVDEMKAKEGPQWELDLENKGQLKELLFNRLDLPVLRMTKAGKVKYGDDLDAAKDRLRSAAKRSAPELKSQPEELERYVEAMLRNYAAVDKFTLNKLTVQFEKLRPLRKYRKVFKLYSTYVRPLQNILTVGLDKKERTKDPHLCFDSCVHSSFLLTGTRSGRLASRDPNLQNMPRDGEVKALYVSRFGERGCIYQSDLSQIELRLLACASGDPTMVKAYFDGTDLHSLTASRIFGVQYEHFTKDYMKSLQDAGKDDEAKEIDQQRTVSKTVNFLTSYGGGAFGLQNVLAMKDIDKQLEECEEIIEAFFDAYPAIRKLLRFYKSFIEHEGVAVSIFGRVRIFDEVYGDDQEAKSKALRAGCNHLIQSTASDMMLIGLFCIEQLMRDAGLESILTSTVHDSLFIDCVRSELSQVHQIVMDVLNNFPTVFRLLFGDDFDTSWLLVPFTGDSEVGLDYLHLKKVPSADASKVDWHKLLHDEED